MTFSSSHRFDVKKQKPKDEGFWNRVNDQILGMGWERKGRFIRDIDLRERGITNWLSLGEETQWKIADEINLERVQKLYDDTLKKANDSKEAKKKWQEEHGTN